DTTNQNDSNSVFNENSKTENSVKDDKFSKENNIGKNDVETSSAEKSDNLISNDENYSGQNIEEDASTNMDAQEIDSVDKEKDKPRTVLSAENKKESEKETDNIDENEIGKSEDVVKTPLEKSEDIDVSSKEKNEKDKKVDYSTLDRDGLTSELDRLLVSNKVNKIRSDVETIKTLFYKEQNVINNKLREDYLKEGGKIEDFIPVEDEYETKFKVLYKKYRKFKAEYNKSLDEEKENNLIKKNKVIEEIKELINKKESIVETFNEFHQLQKKWHEIGQVPQKNLNDLWNTYHHHVQKFYDYVKINKELKDIDLKKNLEKKIELCESAEKLLDEKLIVKAFRTLQKYHNQWREIGPMPNEKRDIIWERFKKITKTINKKHQDYFKRIKEEQKENLQKKTDLCDIVDEIVNLEIESHKLWKSKTAEIIDIQKKWRTIGFTPKKDNNIIYSRFRNSCDKFFDKKHVFYTQNKEWQEKNLKLKIALCEKVEAIKDSEDWKKTTHEFINYQKEWKNIGQVSRNDSDKIWKRFRAACDTFFNRKSEYYSTIEDVYKNNYKLKLEIIEKIENYKFDDDVEVNYASLRDLQDEWAEIGFVPYKLKDEIQNKFREIINKQFDKLKVNDTEKKLLKYKSRIDNLQNNPKSYKKIKQEKEKFSKKMKQLESNISLWENNIGYFSVNSKEGNKMVEDY
ncbi:MAG: DUF349 domain-containing protein, partial [Bacteroidales bacterium]|nr:DUF349 domain-containing protein [Bacteroidales bacterium]